MHTDFAKVKKTLGVSCTTVIIQFPLQPRMEQYFQQMGKIVNDKKNSARVRFMLQDVMDLRLVSISMLTVCL